MHYNILNTDLFDKLYSYLFFLNFQIDIENINCFIHDMLLFLIWVHWILIKRFNFQNICSIIPITMFYNRGHYQCDTVDIVQILCTPVIISKYEYTIYPLHYSLCYYLTTHSSLCYYSLCPTQWSTSSLLLSLQSYMYLYVKRIAPYLLCGAPVKVGKKEVSNVVYL